MEWWVLCVLFSGMSGSTSHWFEWEASLPRSLRAGTCWNCQPIARLSQPWAGEEGTCGQGIYSWGIACCWDDLRKYMKFWFWMVYVMLIPTQVAQSQEQQCRNAGLNPGVQFNHLSEWCVLLARRLLNRTLVDFLVHNEISVDLRKELSVSQRSLAGMFSPSVLSFHRISQLDDMTCIMVWFNASKLFVNEAMPAIKHHSLLNTFDERHWECVCNHMSLTRIL